jgi:hypothetical protein
MEQRATSATIRRARTSLYCMVGQRRDGLKRSRLPVTSDLRTFNQPSGDLGRRPEVAAYSRSRSVTLATLEWLGTFILCWY